MRWSCHGILQNVVEGGWDEAFGAFVYAGADLLGETWLELMSTTYRAIG